MANRKLKPKNCFQLIWWGNDTPHIKKKGAKWDTRPEAQAEADRLMEKYPVITCKVKRAA